MTLYEEVLSKRLALELACLDLMRQASSSKWQSTDIDKADKNLIAFISDTALEYAHDLKGIGNNVPEFFVGDLLELSVYEDYYDSFFYGGDIRTSEEERPKGKEHLAKDLEKELLERDYNLSLDDNKGKFVLRTKKALLAKKASKLPSTHKIYERLTGEDGYESKIAELRELYRKIEQKYPENV